LQVTIAELVVVRAVAPAKSGGLDSDLEFIGGRVRDDSSFLFGFVSLMSQMPNVHKRPHEQWACVGCVTKEEGIQAASPLVRARRKLRQSMTWSSALLGSGRYLRVLKEPLREIFESLGDGGNGAGRSEGEIANTRVPHGSVEADIVVGKAYFDQRWPGTGLASDSCIGEIVASHEGRFKGFTSFAERINLAGRAWIGMRDQSYLVW
jgi:hypothetical protein